MSLVYNFSFTPPFVGQSAVVTDAAGAAVTGSPATLDAAGSCALELDEGTYTATVSNTALGFGSVRTAGVLDLAASVAAGGGDFRTDDVANLIALNVVGDTTSNEVHATMIADARYGALPEWCIDAGGGNWEFDIDAGSITIVGLDVCTIDFSATTAADTPGTINCQVTVKKDGQQITTGQKTIPGDGTDTQVVRGVASDQFSGGTMSILVASVATDDASVAITDGVTSHDVYIKLTREAFGPEEIA